MDLAFFSPPRVKPLEHQRVGVHYTEYTVLSVLHEATRSSPPQGFVMPQTQVKRPVTPRAPSLAPFCASERASLQRNFRDEPSYESSPSNIPVQHSNGVDFLLGPSFFWLLVLGFS